nr:helix-turn-helix transcriptional regulator [Mycobacterium sp. 1164966.3]
MEIHEAGLSLDLPDLVFETRAGANMTQAQLATALGTSKETVAAWESGAETPRVDELAKLARTCGKRLRLSIDVD